MMSLLSLDEAFKAGFRVAARANGKLYEGTITAFYTELAEQWPAGTILIDGGAHNGMHTLPMAALPSVERVIAIEASPSTFARFDTRLRNTVHSRKVDLRLAALQADPGVDTVEFHHSPTHPGRSGTNPLTREKEGVEFDPPIRVPATTIDKLAADVKDRVRFIKLDLEGGEFPALLGGRQTLKASGAVCVFETGRNAPAMNGYTPQDVLDFMEDVGLEAANFFGEPITAETLSAARYAWAFPQGSFEEHGARLQRLVLTAYENRPEA